MKSLFKLTFLSTLILCLGCKAAKLRKDTATETIDKLQSGMLLVRLQTSENKIKKLRAMGENERANEAVKEQQETNSNLIKHFNEHFDFCPVYFFHSNDVQNIKNNDFAGSIFKKPGEDLKDTPVPNTFYLFGELDNSYQDELAAANDENQRIAGTAGTIALVVRDKNHFQIPKPFPFSQAITGFENRNLRAAVISLNEKLHNFDIKMERRKLKKKRKALTD